MITPSLLRTRWAAIGAAVAVTLGAGGLATTYATNPAGAVAFVPITACRLADTRPAPDNVGPRSTPIGAGETLTIAAHGNNGNCTGIPTSATGLSLNVTAIGATSGTFLTIWANGAPQPLASSLNPQPGAPPIPNAVTTGLSAGGEFDIFNGLGSVNVIVDIVGYYTDHNHDDRYYTEAEVDTAFDEVAAALDTKSDAADSRWISIDPLSVNARSGAVVSTGFGANAGLTLPGGPADLPAFEFGITVPPDHTPNTRLTVHIVWHINETSCTVNLTSNFVNVARRGQSPRGSGFGYQVADPVPATANQAALTTFELDTTGFGIAPGDAVIFGLFRSFNNDTCSEPLKIDGIQVQYT